MKKSGIKYIHMVPFVCNSGKKKRNQILGKVRKRLKNERLSDGDRKKQQQKKPGRK